MSCNICGEDNKLFYCERYDCDICEECLCNTDKENGYCNSYGCDEICEYMSECRVLNARKNQLIEEKQDEIKNKLLEETIRFFNHNKVSCVESISQCDWVMENAYVFLEKLFSIVDAK